MKRNQLHSNLPALVLAAFVWLPACSKQGDVAPDSSTSSPELAGLTQQVRRYSLEKRKLPQSLEDLVAAGYIQSIPPAPTGKKYVIDADRAQVVLADIRR